MRSLVRSNLLRLAVLVWFTGWLLLVMPGHTRGIVQVPGGQADQQASCCSPKPSCCTPPADIPAHDAEHPQDAPSDGQPGTPGDPAKHCAICFLKAHLTDPPPVTLYTPYLGEMDELAFLLASSIADDQAAPANLRGRAPPA